MRRAVSGMTLMLLVASILALTPSCRLVGAQESPVTVGIVNPLTGDNKFIFNSTDHPVNSTFTVDFVIANSTLMCGWQIFIEWNNTVINFQAGWIPDNNAFAPAIDQGATLIEPKPALRDEGNGTYSMMYGAAVLPLTSGIVVPEQALLCKANFTIAATPQNDSQIFTNIELIGQAGGQGSSLDSFILVPYTQNGNTFEKTVMISAEPAIVEVFRVAFSLAITSTNGGTTSPESGEYIYTIDQVVSVAAVPDTMFVLGYWELDGVNVGSENPYVVIMNASHALHAVFVVHQPVTWTVDHDGPADFHTIQEAVDSPNVTYGDVILVKSGIYYEHVSVSKWLTLIGENRDTTIIDGGGTGTVIMPCGNMSGFTIRNGEYGIQISTQAAEPQFTGCRIEGNSILSNLYGGISLHACANNTISNNVVASNTLFGIHVWTSANNALVNNTILNNGQGIDFYGHSNGNVLRNNNMTNNKYSFGVILRGGSQYDMYYSGLINDVDASNTVDGKPVYCWVDRNDAVVPPDAGYVWLSNCSNITIYACNLSSNLQGILLFDTNNTVIANNNITSNAYGIYVLSSSNNILLGNTLQDNLNGICLDFRSRLTTMRNNSIAGGQTNFGTYTDLPAFWDASDLLNDIDASNTVDGKPIIYWIGQRDRQVPLNAGYVMLINSTNISLNGLNLTNNAQGIILLASNNTTIENCSISNTTIAIDARGYTSMVGSNPPYFFLTYDMTIIGNVLVDNAVGIRIRSDNSTISNNTLYDNPLGIYLTGSHSAIYRNVVTKSDLNTNPYHELYVFYYPEWPWERSIDVSRLNIGGIIVGGEYNIVSCNTVMDSFVGIDIINGNARDTIFHNNLINNRIQARESAGSRYGISDWDNGYPSGGNYWSNYNGTDTHRGPYQNETGSDGIGDTAFLVFPGEPNMHIDHYPLMSPINIFDAGSWNGANLDVEIVSNSTISNFQVCKTQKTISFNITGQTGVGFCTVSIPNIIVEEFWNGNYSVLVNGETVEFTNWTDTTNTYIYLTYPHSEHVVTVIPEFQSAIILPLLMLLTIFALSFTWKRKVRETQPH